MEISNKKSIKKASILYLTVAFFFSLFSLIPNQAKAETIYAENDTGGSYDTQTSGFPSQVASFTTDSNSIAIGATSVLQMSFRSTHSQSGCNMTASFTLQGTSTEIANSDPYSYTADPVAWTTHNFTFANNPITLRPNTTYIIYPQFGYVNCRM